MTRFRTLISTACVLAMQGVAFAETPAAVAPTDSVTDAVAMFLASNLKQGLESAVSQLNGYGIEIDRPKFDSLLVNYLRQPYNAETHQEASRFVAALIAASSARQSEQMLISAAARPGALRLPSGVVIETLEEGIGDEPTKASTVTMRYTGYLPDGTIFDEMTPTDEPMTARVADMAPGMAEGLTHMRQGGCYDLTIPSELAYGAEGIPGVIPPHSTLRFTVQLIKTD